MTIKKFGSGFTMVEMVVSIGVVLLILPLVFGIAFIISQQQNRILSLQKLKEEGDIAMAQIISTIRNRVQEIATCDGLDLPNPEPSNKICFSDGENPFAYYFTADNQLASTAANLVKGESFTYYLIGNSSNFSFQTSLLSGTAPISLINDNQVIKFDYNIVYTPKVSFEKPQILRYQYSVFLRSKK